MEKTDRSSAYHQSGELSGEDEGFNSRTWSWMVIGSTDMQIIEPQGKVSEYAGGKCFCMWKDSG